jgi:hypothetical protein
MDGSSVAVWHVTHPALPLSASARDGICSAWAAARSVPGPSIEGPKSAMNVAQAVEKPAIIRSPQFTVNRRIRTGA